MKIATDSIVAAVQKGIRAVLVGVATPGAFGERFLWDEVQWLENIDNGVLVTMRTGDAFEVHVTRTQSNIEPEGEST